MWFDIDGAQVPGPKRIEVKVSHTEASPLDLVLAMPDDVPPGSVVVVDETTAQRAEAAAERAEAIAARLESLPTTPAAGFTVSESSPGVLAITPTGGATITESTPGILTIGF